MGIKVHRQKIFSVLLLGLIVSCNAHKEQNKAGVAFPENNSNTVFDANGKIVKTTENFAKGNFSEFYFDADGKLLVIKQKTEDSTLFINPQSPYCIDEMKLLAGKEMSLYYFSHLTNQKGDNILIFLNERTKRLSNADSVQFNVLIDSIFTSVGYSYKLDKNEKKNLFFYFVKNISPYGILAK